MNCLANFVTNLSQTNAQATEECGVAERSRADCPDRRVVLLGFQSVSVATRGRCWQLQMGFGLGRCDGSPVPSLQTTSSSNRSRSDV